MKTRRCCLLMAAALSAVLCISSCAGAETQDAPFDLSEYQSRIDELGIPTMASVREIADQAQAAFANGQHEEAIPLLREWAKKANWLANMISAGLEPFYNASYDAQKSFSLSRITVLGVYEGIANELKTQRNHAFVLEAECHVALQHPNDAVSLYMKALDLLDVKDWDWWLRAANGLYSIIGVAPIVEPSKKK